MPHYSDYMILFHKLAIAGLAMPPNPHSATHTTKTLESVSSATTLATRVPEASLQIARPVSLLTTETTSLKAAPVNFHTLMLV
jgi:hypothetical protein